LTQIWVRCQNFGRRAPYQLSQLVHEAQSPDIVFIFDADFDQGYPFIAMEFVEARTLRQLIRAHPAPLDSHRSAPSNRRHAA